MKVIVIADSEAQESALAQRVKTAARTLSATVPYGGRWIERSLRRVTVLDIRHQPVTLDARAGELLLGLEYVREQADTGLALILLYAAVQCRLYPMRRGPADRHAQLLRRVHREVASAAIRFDQLEDPNGYIAGISTERWHLWADTWHKRGVLNLLTPLQWRRRRHRDLARLGAPRWLRRIAWRLMSCRARAA